MLAAVLLGPWAGTLVMACVIAVQALVFQDGGLVVMGANIFNMGIVGTLGGYYVYRALSPGSSVASSAPGSRPPGSPPGLSVVAGSTCMALELAISGTTPLSIALPAMVGVHLLIGIGEALITMAALAFIQVARPDLFQLRDAAPARRSGRPRRPRPDGGRSMQTLRRFWWVVGLGDRRPRRHRACAAGVAGSRRPRVGRRRRTGFLENAHDALYSIIPDYTVPGVDDPVISTILAGLVGVVIVFAV